MAENSQPSRANGKRNTSKTSKLIPEAALEILTQSFRLVEEAGIDLEVSDTKEGVTVTIRDTNFVGGIIVPHIPPAPAPPT